MEHMSPSWGREIRLQALHTPMEQSPFMPSLQLYQLGFPLSRALFAVLKEGRGPAGQGARKSNVPVPDTSRDEDRKLAEKSRKWEASCVL